MAVIGGIGRVWYRGWDRDREVWNREGQVG